MPIVEIIERDTFEDVEPWMVHLKSFITRSLLEWSHVLGPSATISIVNLIDSCSFQL